MLLLFLKIASTAKKGKFSFFGAGNLFGRRFGAFFVAVSTSSRRAVK